jgi:uncharacterized BrkB/YihY/UPF0761 family membrane protein
MTTIRPPGDPTDEAERSTGRLAALTEDVRARLTAVAGRVPFADTAIGVYERDRHAAGTLLGSALALRLFLFFVPMLLFLVGATGLIGRYSTIETLADRASIGGALAREIDGALDQGTLAPWLAILTGLIGMAWTGRSMSRALVLSSALSWQLGGRQRLPVRIIGIVVGLVTGIGLAFTIANLIRDAAGVAVVSASYVAIAAVYVVMWALLYLNLPRATTDPGATLPGSLLVAVVLAGLQAVTQLYLPRQVSEASSIYGTFGAVAAVLGWFFIIGRSLAFSFSLNAVVYEIHGSVSRLVFGLPVVRLLPRRFPVLVRYFDLDSPAREPTDGTS